MARQGGLDAYLGRLHVAYLADHHDVGVGAQDVPQTRGEGQADLGVDLDLVQPRYLELHGVLDGYDVLLRGVDLVQGGVERGGLAATRRPGDQDGPVRPAEDGLVALVVPRREAQLLQVGVHGGRVEQPQDYLLAVGRGQRGDPEVYLLLVELDGEAPVLGHPLLGDVQVPEELEPGRHGVLELGGDGHYLPEYAVNPEADRQLARLGLDVDVRGAVPDRVLQHRGNQADYGPLVRAGLDPEVQLVFFVGTLGGGIFEYLVDLLARREDLGLRGADLILARDDRCDLVPGDDPQVLQRIQVAGVAHRDDEVTVGVYPQGESAVLAQHPLGHEVHNVAVHVPLGELHVVQTEPLGLSLRQVGAGDEPKREQQLAQVLLGVVLLGLQRQTHLILAYLALVDEDVGYLDPGPDPPGAGDLGVRALLPKCDLLVDYVAIQLSLLLKRPIMDQRRRLCTQPPVSMPPAGKSANMPCGHFAREMSARWLRALSARRLASLGALSACGRFECFGVYDAEL